MGWLDRFRRQPIAAAERPINIKKEIAIGAMPDESEDSIQTFDNSNITYRGELTGFKYNQILRNKQGNIRELYSLAEYYRDADDIVHGMIKHVFVPYSICSPWQLLNVGEKTRNLYELKYKQIKLREKMSSIFLQYWTYGNVVVYYLNGNIITLPIHKCRIGNLMLNGDPVVDFDCQSIISEWKEKGYSVRENWIEDNKLQEVFKGYPPEVYASLNAGKMFAQLDPKNTYVLQAEKEDWMRYAVPFIAACLPYLAKKELISKYEDAMLNLAIHSFVHVKYGDTKADILPNMKDLIAARGIFSKAMNGFPLAVTNQLATADVVKPNSDDLFQWDKYRNVNQSILSAGGVSGLIVTGTSDDASTFASAQVSMETAAARIESARDKFCEMMDRINKRILEDMKLEHRNNLKQEPKFVFMPLDMAGKKSLRDACMDLWQKGVVSTKTLMEANGYSVEREKALREHEASSGLDEILIPRDITVQKYQTDTSNTAEPLVRDDGDNDVGRPEEDMDERTSDPENAIRGKLPKPSNPEGSM